MMIIAHLLLLCAYGQSWWLPHFQWQKHVNDRSKLAYFLGRHMALRFYVQHRDQHVLMNNWKTNIKFRDFVRMFPNNSTEYTTDKLVEYFFKRVDTIHTKYVAQWRNKYLHLALTGDYVPARYLANCILGHLFRPLALEYVSSKHKITINIAATITCLSQNNTPENQRQNEYVIDHRAVIKLIAEGKICGLRTVNTCTNPDNT